MRWWDDGGAGFATPFTGVTKSRLDKCDLASVVGMKQRLKVGWGEAEVKMISVRECREKSRQKQSELVKSKMKKNINRARGREDPHYGGGH